MSAVYTPHHDRYNRLSYRRCGRSGLKLPAVSLGLWHKFGGVDDADNSRAMIHPALHRGNTHFDLVNK